jgi:PKD domain
MTGSRQDPNGRATQGRSARGLPILVVACLALFALGGGWALANKTSALSGQTRHAAQTKLQSAKSRLRLGCRKRQQTCDTSPPDTLITSSPSATMTVTSASFGFISTESGSTFQCKLDASRWRSCGSPKAYSGLNTGSHTFSVRATDAMGNVDPTPASDTWAVEPAPLSPPPDTTPPDTSISSGPSGTTTSTSASFAFDSTELFSSFECRLDSGAFAACTSPKAYSSLSEGAHTFSVRATDAAGNVDPTPATQSWTVEAPPPPPSVVEAVWSAPSNPQVNIPVLLDGTRSTGSGALTCTWTFEDETGSTLFATEEGCAIDFTFTSSGTKYVRLSVSDSAGGSASNKQSFVVASAPDTTPPDTTISSGPSGTTTSTSASFSFSSTESGSSFECRLDSGAFAACTSPKAYLSLSTGSHTFSVRATDSSGNVDPTPATRSWTVEASAPPPSGSNCFSAPSSCGYPVPADTGVPAGTTLTSSGAITASTAGQVIDGKDVSGGINVKANNVTIQNSRVSNQGDCGSTNTCGNWSIRIEAGVTGTVIRNVETVPKPGTTCEHDIRNTSSGTLEIVGSYLHACDSSIYSVGNTTLRDSYSIAKITISTDHVENVYFNDSTFTAIHDTMLNPIGQTAVIFGNVHTGSGGTCSNHLTVEESLLAGGGYTLYPCGNGTSAGSSTRVVKNNHFARCLSAEVQGGGGTWLCKSGPDANGYYPKSGDYGIVAFDFGGTWSGNVWDDNLSSIPAP